MTCPDHPVDDGLGAPSCAVEAVVTGTDPHHREVTPMADGPGGNYYADLADQHYAALDAEADADLEAACPACGHVNGAHVDNGDGPRCAHMIVADIRGGADECGCPGPSADHATDQAEDLGRLMHTSVLRHHPEADNADLVEVQWDDLDQPVRDAYLAVAGDVLAALAPPADGDHATVDDVVLRDHSLAELGLNHGTPRTFSDADRDRELTELAASWDRTAAEERHTLTLPNLTVEEAHTSEPVARAWEQAATELRARLVTPAETETERFPVGDDVAGQAR